MPEVSHRITVSLTLTQTCDSALISTCLSKLRKREKTRVREEEGGRRHSRRWLSISPHVRIHNPTTVGTTVFVIDWLYAVLALGRRTSMQHTQVYFCAYGGIHLMIADVSRSPLYAKSETERDAYILSISACQIMMMMMTSTSSP